MRTSALSDHRRNDWRKWRGRGDRLSEGTLLTGAQFASEESEGKHKGQEPLSWQFLFGFCQWLHEVWKPPQVYHPQWWWYSSTDEDVMSGNVLRWRRRLPATPWYQESQTWRASPQKKRRYLRQHGSKTNQEKVGRIEHSPSKKEMQLYNDVWSLFIGQVSSKERKREEGVKKSTRTSEIFGRQVKRVSTTLHTSSQLTHT